MEYRFDRYVENHPFCRISFLSGGHSGHHHRQSDEEEIPLSKAKRMGEDSLVKPVSNHRTVCIFLCRSGPYNRCEFRCGRLADGFLCHSGCLLFLSYGAANVKENLRLHPRTVRHNFD